MSRKNLLILSCNTGEGHNSAAFAVAEGWRAQGNDCEVIDAMSFGGEKPKRIVADTYNSMIVNKPELFGKIYRAGEWYRDTRLASPVYAANKLYAKKLLTYLTEKAYDAVLCTHLFPMEAVTYLKRKSRLRLPSFGVLTDYTCIPFMEETELDVYFSPHASVTDECVGRGMKRGRFQTTGIPVHKRFGESMPNEQAKNYLVIPKDRPIYLVMTGGMGCVNVLELCRSILARDDAVEVYVLTGRNDTLNSDLKKAYRGERVHPVVFTEKVDVYMKAADVIITKPGGISSTEAAVLGVPTVHVSPIPGCETVNANFFSSRGMSVYAWSPEEAASSAHELAQSRDSAEAMRAAQRSNTNPRAAADIVEYMKVVC